MKNINSTKLFVSLTASLILFDAANATNQNWANIEGALALQEQNRRQAESSRSLTREETLLLGAIFVGAAKAFKEQGKNAPKPTRHYYATTGRAKNLAGHTLTFNETHRAIGKIWLDESGYAVQKGPRRNDLYVYEWRVLGDNLCGYFADDPMRTFCTTILFDEVTGAVTGMRRARSQTVLPAKVTMGDEVNLKSYQPEGLPPPILWLTDPQAYRQKVVEKGRVGARPGQSGSSELVKYTETNFGKARNLAGTTVIFNGGSDGDIPLWFDPSGFGYYQGKRQTDNFSFEWKVNGDRVCIQNTKIKRRVTCWNVDYDAQGNLKNMVKSGRAVRPVKSRKGDVFKFASKISR